MTTQSEIIANAAQITVINDGQVQYPVLTSELNEWVTKNGKITNDNYEQFCSDVEYVGAEIGIVGSSEIIDLCEELINAGADSKYLG